MPGLDYKNAVPPSIGGASLRDVFERPGKPIYGPHNTVTCPDCGCPAIPDLDGGTHGGQCLDDVPVANPHSALGIIHLHALNNPHFSVEDVRLLLDAAGIKQEARGPAFGAAKRKKYIEQDGVTLSTGATAKRASVQTYTSLIYRPLTAAQRAKETA